MTTGNSWRHIKALLWRNALYRKRTWLSSIIQLILPCLTIGILVVIRFSLRDSDSFKPKLIDAIHPTQSYTPYSFLDYLHAILEPKFCVPVPKKRRNKFRRRGKGIDFYISGIDIEDWQVPFVKCDARRCGEEQKDASPWCEFHVLAVVAPSSFVEYVEGRYPQLAQIRGMENRGYDVIQRFDSSKAIDDYVESREYGTSIDKPKIALAVIIQDKENDSKTYEYTIRTNSTNFNSPEIAARPAQPTQPSTKVLFNTFAKTAKGSCEAPGGTAITGDQDSICNAQYMYNGAIPIQRLVNDWILQNTGAEDLGYKVAENGVSFANFPSAAYTEDGFYGVIAPYTSLLMVLGLLYSVSSSIRMIVAEKESRQKELMKMMSISEIEIGFSWFLSLYTFFFTVGVLTTIATNLLYPQASFLLLLLFWEIAFAAIVLYIMTISALNKKATRGTMIGILLFFAGYFLTLVADYETGKRATILLLSIHPMTAISYGLQIIGRLEETTVGLTGNTWRFSDSPSGYAVSSTIGSLILDLFLWGGVCWYCNRVIPGDYGYALQWNFFCKKSYWCGTTNEAEVVDDHMTSTLNNNAQVPIEEVSTALAEQENDGRGVHIRGLTKTFGDKNAVDNLDLSMYTGQVFALLGHNGAGKTTTINMLTGMVPPTSGFAQVGGKNIRTQMTDIRESIGICPQHDCLFPLLTVTEHIQFFAMIKGLYERLSRDEAENSVVQSIEDVALLEKRDTFSSDLSGGMKRKLSLAIAFCGDSKVVFLDEPTSGMDPFSRRFTWNVIRQNRQDRCIVLTTHFMDEADLLGDRIGIMGDGQLRCCGSSIFLKKEFGVGYAVTIEKVPDMAKEGVEVFTKIDHELNQVVYKSVENAAILSNIGREITFQLPIDASEHFVEIFYALDKYIENGKLVVYGVSVTTLDEVFLMVARGENGCGQRDTLCSSALNVIPENLISDSQQSYRAEEQISDKALFLVHTKSLFTKRAINFKRDKKAWICSTILPSLFALLGFILVTQLTANLNMPPLELKLSDYNTGLIPDKRRNPIPFGSANKFSCQPGTCISSSDFGNSTSFCGRSTYLQSNPECYATPLLDHVPPYLVNNQTGASVVEQNVSSILDASLIMFNDSVAASQYGALYFTTNSSSDTTDSNETVVRSYSELVQKACNSSLINTTSFDCSVFEGLGYVVNTNFTSLHASMLFQTLADEAFIRAALISNDYDIKTTIHPLPITDAENKVKNSADAFSAWFLLILSFPFITGSFANFIVQERMSKAKHLQTVAGVKPEAYWLATYFWDILNYQFPLWTVIMLMYAFNVDAFITNENGVAGGTILIMLFFGPAAAGFTYIVSFLFKSPSKASTLLICFNFLIGLVGPLVCLILKFLHAAFVLNGEKSNLKIASQAIEWCLRLFPSFSFGKALLYAINLDGLRLISGGGDIDVWSSEILLIEVIFLVVQSVLYPWLAICIDKLSTKPKVIQIINKLIHPRWCTGLPPSTVSSFTCEVEDEDVIAENERIISGGANSDLILADNLVKKYLNGKIAVNKLSFGIPPGQCFGLLGINGAGKTTTMAMMTAEFPPSSGDAMLAGFSVTTQPEQTRRRIGYCPQFDAHFMNLTGTEHVSLYAAIKGVSSDSIDEAVRSKLDEVGLNEYDSERLSSKYSGGMKRKLSVACATIGNPQIVFLDEPSTGMDPVSRRDLWNVISNMVTGHASMNPVEKTSVILTTHSMEECEALCPRIGIMAGGKLKCLGSAQHLKSRYGTGYQIELKVMEASKGDHDVEVNLTNLINWSSNNTNTEDSDAGNGEMHSMVFNLSGALASVQHLTGDEYLSSKINSDDPGGYLIFKNAKSDVGLSVYELAAFCTNEIRLRDTAVFFEENYPESILRERQDAKMRFEVPSKGTKISSVFETIENNKNRLRLSDYGVSQTTLEQVFNTHAANAEEEKLGTID